MTGAVCKGQVVPWVEPERSRLELEPLAGLPPTTGRDRRDLTIALDVLGPALGHLRPGERDALLLEPGEAHRMIGIVRHVVEGEVHARLVVALGDFRARLEAERRNGKAG